ncbi:unnamed protein product [Moneuplotes crassus]|uniref:EGF-like domain-containing protein n=1 Tax=Euplotes crassus TaxID=5936 RepID=A0AAD1U5P6_EUPCR|nr:unnamed protein product [Moneuplotes crassus]
MVIKKSSETSSKLPKFSSTEPEITDPKFQEELPEITNFITNTAPSPLQRSTNKIKENLKINGFEPPNSITQQPKTLSQKLSRQDRGQGSGGREMLEMLSNDLREYPVYFSDHEKGNYGDFGEDGAPKAYLIEPYARRGTSKSLFNAPPCGDGIQGNSKFLAQPGSKAQIQWIIQNPVPGGHCQIKLSSAHSDDISSYNFLQVNVNDFNSRTGTFSCGDPQKTIEEATVVFPYDIYCERCTLQWIYNAPGYGSIFQCSDISLQSGEVRENECPVECINGGVCQDSLCYCAAGYFGESCENIGDPKQFYEPVAHRYPLESPYSKSLSPSDTSGSMGFFGWYFLFLFLALLISGLIAAFCFFFYKNEIKEILGMREREDPRNLRKDFEQSDRRDIENIREKQRRELIERENKRKEEVEKERKELERKLKQDLKNKETQDDNSHVEETKQENKQKAKNSKNEQNSKKKDKKSKKSKSKSKKKSKQSKSPKNPKSPQKDYLKVPSPALH